jgi:hypothetical protein
MLLLIILLFIIVILFFNNNSGSGSESEGFENAHARVSFYRRPNNQPLEDDTLFRNVVTFNNDNDPWLPGQQSSLEKCMKNCTNGKCVEMGHGSSTICFPHVSPDHKLHTYLSPCSRKYPSDFLK